MKKIYVGNLSYKTTKETLSQAFRQFGEVASVNIVEDRHSGRSKGYAFVEMEDAGAAKAIEGLNGTELDGRSLRLDEARPRTEEDRRPPRRERSFGGGNRDRSYGEPRDRSYGGNRDRSRPPRRD